MINKICLLTLISSLAICAQAQVSKTNPDCPGNGLIPEALVTNPVGLKSYLEANSLNIKTPADLICCLPKSYRENFVVAPASIAGQNGNPSGPRVLFFNSFPENAVERGLYNPALKSLLSINGGDPSLNQNLSVEALFVRNKPEPEPEFFDIDFSGNEAHLGGKNPALCMGCHGRDGKAPPEGAKLIFDTVRSWMSFANGFSPCTAAEKKWLAEFNKTAKESLLNNPQYRCLDKSGPSMKALDGDRGPGAQPIITNLDFMLNEADSWRVARYIEQAPGYQNFKYALIGLLKCPNKKPSTWLPDSILSQLKSERTITSEIRNGSDPFDSLKQLLTHENSVHLANDSLVLKQIDKIKVQGPFASPIYRGPASCPADFAEELPNIISEARADQTGHSTFDKYIADSKFRSGIRELGDELPLATVRFLFESRGVDLSSIAMQAGSGSYVRMADGFAQILGAKEPSESPIRKLSDPTLAVSPQARDLACEELTKLSKAAFTETERQPAGQKSPTGSQR